MNDISWSTPELECCQHLNGFEPFSSKEELHLEVRACQRDRVLPALSVRRARVEDYDDLLPVQQRCQARGHCLSRFPEWYDEHAPGRSRGDGDFALAGIIEAQDDDNCVLVATAERKLVSPCHQHRCFLFNVLSATAEMSFLEICLLTMLFSLSQ